MRELRLYTHDELAEQLKFQESAFIDAFSKLLSNKLLRYAMRDAEKASDAEYFQIRSEDKDFATWFYGGVGVMKIVEGYYTGIVCGQFTGGKAGDFQSIARLAHEEYGKHFPAAYDIIETLVYNTSSVAAGQRPHFSFEYTDSREPN